MQQSLSIIVAAHNAQYTIATQVANLLEVATDLTADFEVLVVDDGSVDQTEEVAYELTRLYPQVRLVRHETQLGIPAAIRTGMGHTSGDIVLVQDEPVAISPSEVRRLWALGADDDVLMAGPDPVQTGPKPLSAELLERLMAWGANVAQTAKEQQRSGLQMIRRHAAVISAEQLDYKLEGIGGTDEPTTPLRSPNFATRVDRSNA